MIIIITCQQSQYDDEDHQYDDDGSPVDRVKLHPDDRIVRSVLDRALHLNLSGHYDDDDDDDDEFKIKTFFLELLVSLSLYSSKK